MSSVILNQINGIYRLFADGLIESKEEARKGMTETVKYYFDNPSDYADYIDGLFKQSTAPPTAAGIETLTTGGF